MATKTAKATGTIETGHHTPHGDPGILLTCTCRTHPMTQQRAIVHADLKAGIEANPSLIHGYVLAVWGPLGAGLGRQRVGKWRSYIDPTIEHATAYFARLGFKAA